jgi:hypothetical protein
MENTFSIHSRVFFTSTHIYDWANALHCVPQIIKKVSEKADCGPIMKVDCGDTGN